MNDNLTTSMNTTPVNDDVLGLAKSKPTTGSSKDEFDHNNILVVKNLTKIYKNSDRGVSDLNFVVKKGEMHAFIGENGSGKTTTIKTIINAYTNYSGEILIDGFDHRLPISRAKLGYVPEIALFPEEVTTFEYLYSLAILSGVNKKEAKEKIRYYLQKFEISHLENKKPISFSSGQKKKVLLIQALIHDPELIILDEPTANLDPSSRHEVFMILKELNDNQKTVFLCSHILREMESFANSLTLIHRGKLIYTGPKYDELEKIYYESVIKLEKEKKENNNNEGQE
ncbi:ABC transporter ATP-binding protein [Ureaplasma zalophigenitalium]|uniref:ABC transporter ATP-binding protein n=1 Tax=Ureaplasma zalophigenitalium TaxID=907723 RepID=A0ABT3BPM3_9BACT|nr:ABC transporter ATP-binding protein [Ureaplasma zalophigenitalium]MCV3753963.1 ABC transporter ATP-binding protein [Ureaplasma zalophigenitalium]